MDSKLPELAPEQPDVLIVGAGISGISMAAHLKMLCPTRSFAIAERRGDLGGTWDLFRYPGIRSDSDMHSFGFRFEPWIDEQSIADGKNILDYLNRVVDERGIREHIAFGQKVLSADWNGAAARWTVTLEGSDGARSTMSPRFLYLGSGYYDYDAPHDPRFPGTDAFGGTIVHPQFWPDRLDYAGKKVVIIGSGATAVTMLPAMARDAAHVTMLQRTPTWMGSRPQKDAVANFLRAVLPEKLAYKITRFKNIRLHNFIFKRARAKPEKVAAFLTKNAQKALGPAWNEKDFVPPYNPWEQRLCLVPDGDLFEAVKAGNASLVTDTIGRFDETGIQLTSGEHLAADIIVTATGLTLTMGGKIALSLDGEPLDFARHWFYRGCMFSNVPNFAVVFGYLNASWTLRADNTANYICEVLNRMETLGADIAVPALAEDHGMAEDNPYAFSSGYLERARHLMPKSAAALPWRHNMDYLADVKDFRERPVDDGVLRFGKAAG
ncbi:MAG: NAD(P)/FAD-dependent oxidoreductase [Candidatus Andeanibacterium colombiense]|uniref:NAD(P)/FAD-dependent oxidoreductase n=1 Tax=Candidatus Andeanibacterium colombiense TaxID=3121345 RepID=A0AAJ5X4J5_9SPHN|nr:MAG: NAD(P)/FAD-dependent oxidoreductase [Sphingomonadaceae bacterium]